MQNSSAFQYLAIDTIRESTTNPRRTFDEIKLQELAESIKHHGLIQPITVHRGGSHRRWKALASRETDQGDIQSRGWKRPCLFGEHHGMTPVPLSSLLNGFVSTEWGACLEAAPADSGTHVYAIIVTADNGQIPLYVGQTARLCGRIGDYTTAQFHAPTDFRVGEAIKYLRTQKACRVDFFYRPSEAQLQDEKVLIREFLLAGYTLLNFLVAFDYKTANRDKERSLVHTFCDMALLRSKAPPT